MAEYHFDLFADYHQFYLQDERAEGDLSHSWTQEATDRLLALAPSTIGVGTVRDTTVPILVEVLNKPPDDNLNAWDQVNECSIQVPSGRIVIAGCTDYFPEAARIDVPPGWYRVRIYYGKLDRVSADGLEGEDHYQIVLWPAEQAEARVLKQRTIGEGEA